MAASLSSDRSTIDNASLSQDARATVEAIQAYGAQVAQQGDSFTVTGTDLVQTPEDVVDCGESGSTIRFVTPVLSHAKGISVTTGGPSLRKRPMQPLLDALSQLGVQCYSTRNDGCAPLILWGGTYKGGSARMPGDISSQFISGLLFTAPLAAEGTSINLATPLQSVPYVQMTLRVLADHGLEIKVNSELTRFRVEGGQSAHSHDHVIEGDYSSAAFILAAGAITNSEVGVSGLQTSDSLQGDSKILHFLTDMGVGLDIDNETVWVRSSKLRRVQIEAGDYPDLVPPITAAACYAQGTTRIVNAERLRIKESDRLAALTCELRKMGAKIQESSDGLEINGPTQLRGANIDSHGDHRIAMACATAALAAKGETVIHGAHCVAKSYPRFFDDLRHLGGDIVGWQ